MRRVAVVQECLMGYRMAFYEQLRDKLRAHGVGLELHHGPPPPAVAARGGVGRLPWTTPAANYRLRLSRAHHAVWQPVVTATRGADLVVVEQASRLLVNYPLLARQWLGGPRVALWGHGVNLHGDGSLASRAGEAAKRWYSRIPHWWFAYTEGSARRVTGLGFPRHRVTVVQNAMDTSALSGWYDSVTRAEAERAYEALGLSGHRVCLYVGSLYPDKRLGFLVEAGRMIAAAVPDFALVVVGSGPDQDVLGRAAACEPWLRHLPARFGRENAVLARGAQLMLMPGAVGLGVLDSFALRLPMVTTPEGRHGPEIEYLRHEVNGLMLGPGGSAGAYADEVIRLLGDPIRIERLRSGCSASARVHTVEGMAERFAGGVMGALGLTKEEPCPSSNSAARGSR